MALKITNVIKIIRFFLLLILSVQNGFLIYTDLSKMCIRYDPRVAKLSVYVLKFYKLFGLPTSHPVYHYIKKFNILFFYVDILITTAETKLEQEVL